jgi:AbiU2
VIEDPEVASEVRALVDAAKARSEFAREWRNRHIAHRDLVLALDAKAEPLPGVSRQHVEDALASFAAIINALHTRYLDGEVAFGHFVAHGDADALVYWLQFAARSEQLQQERSRQHRSLPEDFEPVHEA